MEEQTRISSYGIFIWSLAVLFFFYEFFLRIFLGTIANEVREELSLSIRQFSFIAAAYYVIYAAMQIPVGILAEKIGMRIILSSASFICTLGVYLLIMAQSFYPALVSRLLIGFGSSFGFVALLIIALNWFPRKYFGFLCGASIFLGAVGPMLAGAPLAYVNHLVDGNWRLILLWIGIFGVILTLLLVIFMRSKPPEKEQRIIFMSPQEPLSRKLFELIKNRQAWYVFICSSSLYCPMPLLAAYFGTSYLQARGFEKTAAAFIVSMIWVGYAIGNPIIGQLSDYFKKRTPFLYLFAFLGVAVSSIVLYVPFNHFIFLNILFFVLGAASSAQGLAYALIVEHTPKSIHSAALGFNNSGGMLFGAIIPSMAGFIIQTAMQGSGFETPTISEYTDGLIIIPIIYAVAGIIAFLMIKETFCRQQHEVYMLQPLHKASELF